MNTLNTPQKRALFLPLEGLMEEDHHGAVRTCKGSRKAQTSTSLWVLTRLPPRPPGLALPHLLLSTQVPSDLIAGPEGGPPSRADWGWGVEGSPYRPGQTAHLGT